MPVLVEHTAEGDVVTPQSAAILRHLARVHGLYGTNEAEALRCDVVCGTAMDLRNTFAALRFSPGWADPAARAKHADDIAPKHLARLAKLLGDLDWFASEAPTFADLVAYDTIDGHFGHWPDAAAAMPTLAAFRDRVRALPTMRAYLGTQRPA